MRTSVGYLALVGLAVTASIANAAPRPRTGRHKTPATAPKPRAKATPSKREHAQPVWPHDVEPADTRVAMATPSVEVDEEAIEIDDAPVAVHQQAIPASSDWQVAIGPYIWVPSVATNVSSGSSGGGGGGGRGGGSGGRGDGGNSASVKLHIRFGLPLVGEARLGRFSIYGDMLYGVIGIDAGKEEGPVMVTVDGAVSDLQLDGFAGYRAVGDEHSVLSLEVRGGIRYQRAVVAGTLGASDSNVVAAGAVEVDTAAIAGARAFVRPWNRLYVSAAGDVGVLGTSTWSASVEASLRASSHVLVSVGYRALSETTAGVDVVMYGPRAVVEAVF